jgi:16S rRNA (uracil1498-N3)-methyltransferase
MPHYTILSCIQIKYNPQMNVVYCPQAQVGSAIELDESEFHHLQVLRIRAGESIDIFDGKGNLYRGKLSAVAKKAATIQIIELIKNTPRSMAQLHIAIAPTKNTERTEWFIEKATEIGIHTITPVICRRSERRELRADRLEKVILSAAKQSLHLHLPVLNNAVSLKEFLTTTRHSSAKKFIAYCEEHTTHLKDSFQPGESIIVLIGPEGDFAEEEITLAKQNGFIPVSLGESRLRTETAGVMVSAVFNTQTSNNPEGMKLL